MLTSKSRLLILKFSIACILRNFINITGSMVALHCGNAHVQSQWERANFFTPNDIKIPEIFQIWTWCPWLCPRDLYQCKFSFQSIQRGASSQIDKKYYGFVTFSWFVTWLYCIFLGHMPRLNPWMDVHGLWLIQHVFAFWGLRQYWNSFGGNSPKNSQRGREWATSSQMGRTWKSWYCEYKNDQLAILGQC